MKKLFLIAFYFFALTVYSQNPTPFDNSIRVKNLATQSGTPDIAVFDNNKVLKKIAWSSLPAGSSSVLEYANFAAFPGTGAVAKIYVDKATNIIYRWSGSAYVILSPFTTPTLQQVTDAGNETTQHIKVKVIDETDEYLSEITPYYIEISKRDIASSNIIRSAFDTNGIVRYNTVDGGYSIDLTEASDAVPTLVQRVLKAPILTADATIATTAYVDAKVQNSLTASTTIAPSATAVNNELNKTRKLIIANGASTVTGTTAETIISSLLIPANSFDSLCDIWTTFTYVKSTAAAVPIRLYYNTTNSLSGATQLALYNTGSFRNGMLNRKYLLNGTGLDLLASASTTSLYNSELIDAFFTASTVITIAPTSDIYFIYTVQNDAVGTTFNHKCSTVEKRKLN
jgi:GTP:adenosylcobinamide-phosphate guanylyltransferase